MVVNGEMHYQNRCIDTTEGICGTCGLSALTCSEEGFQCDRRGDSILEGLNLELVECDGSSPSAALVFLDPHAQLDELEEPDGSREKPFLDIHSATNAAVGRGAVAVIIGGSPTFEGLFQVVDGVSLIGGFTGFPEFNPAPEEQPRFEVGIEDFNLDAHRLTAVEAFNIIRPTRLRHLYIGTADLGDIDAVGREDLLGGANIALLAIGAPALILGANRKQTEVCASARTGAGKMAFGGLNKALLHCRCQ